LIKKEGYRHDNKDQVRGTQILKRSEPCHSKMMKSTEHIFESTIRDGISDIESADLKNAGSIVRS